MQIGINSQFLHFSSSKQLAESTYFRIKSLFLKSLSLMKPIIFFSSPSSFQHLYNSPEGPIKKNLNGLLSIPCLVKQDRS